MPFADSSFDLIWSLESGEHMPDKHKARSRRGNRKKQACLRGKLP